MTPSSEEKIRAARGLCENGSWPEALAFAQRWQAENPADAKAWFYAGAALAATSRFTEAAVSYRRALALDTKDFKAWNNLAGILFDSLEQPAEGLRCLEQALKLDPQNKLAWSNLASMAGRLGRHARALEFADRAIALDPQCVEAQLHKAAAARELGKPDAVREACDALAQIGAEKFRRAQ